MTRLLEAVSQRELLYTWRSERRTVVAKPCLRRVVIYRVDVKAHRIRKVEYLPCKLEILSFVDDPALGEAGIDSEVSIAAELVSLPSFSGICAALGESCLIAGLDGRRI